MSWKLEISSQNFYVSSTLSILALPGDFVGHILTVILKFIALQPLKKPELLVTRSVDPPICILNGRSCNKKKVTGGVLNPS